MKVLTAAVVAMSLAAGAVRAQQTGGSGDPCVGPDLELRRPPSGPGRSRGRWPMAGMVTATAQRPRPMPGGGGRADRPFHLEPRDRDVRLLEHRGGGCPALGLRSGPGARRLRDRRGGAFGHCRFSRLRPRSCGRGSAGRDQQLQLHLLRRCLRHQRGRERPRSFPGSPPRHAPRAQRSARDAHLPRRSPLPSVLPLHRGARRARTSPRAAAGTCSARIVHRPGARWR